MVLKSRGARFCNTVRYVIVEELQRTFLVFYSNFCALCSGRMTSGWSSFHRFVFRRLTKFLNDLIEIMTAFLESLSEKKLNVLRIFFLLLKKALLLVVHLGLSFCFFILAYVLFFVLVYRSCCCTE